MRRLLNLRRVGGINFGRIGRLGFSFWVSKPKAAPTVDPWHSPASRARSAWLDPA
jgi:hypothetical protein